jgi:transposase
MSVIKTAGIYLAKIFISIHTVGSNNKCKLHKTIKRNNLLAQITKLPPCIIVMQVCSGAYYWVRKFSKLGHDLHIIAS